MKVRPNVAERGTTHNFNDVATIKLNWEGMLMMLENYGTEYLDVCHPEWQYGTVVMELHQVAYVFGSAMFMGPPPPIELSFQLRRM